VIERGLEHRAAFALCGNSKLAERSVMPHPGALRRATSKTLTAGAKIPSTIRSFSVVTHRRSETTEP
jgi:hypothetical protein